jgi:hypothetical protein
MTTAREILETHVFESSPHLFCVAQLFCHLHKNSDLKRKSKKLLPIDGVLVAVGLLRSLIEGRRGGGKRIADICSWVTHLWYNQEQRLLF